MNHYDDSSDVGEELSDKERSKLEKEFAKAAKEANKLINAELKKVKAAIKKVEDISEKYGVPFYGIGPIFQTYTPTSFAEKFPKQAEYHYDLDLGQNSPDEYEGWAHSAVCD